MQKAVVLEGQFLPEEWGGCNELHLLRNGKVGILGHIAKYDEAKNRHYYATAFCFDYRTGEYTPMKIIAVRDNFLDLTKQAGRSAGCDIQRRSRAGTGTGKAILRSE